MFSFNSLFFLASLLAPIFSSALIMKTLLEDAEVGDGCTDIVFSRKERLRAKDEADVQAYHSAASKFIYWVAEWDVIAGYPKIGWALAPRE